MTKKFIIKKNNLNGEEELAEESRVFEYAGSIVEENMNNINFPHTLIENYSVKRFSVKDAFRAIFWLGDSIQIAP